MTQTFHYFSPATPGNAAWDVDLGQEAVRLGEEPGFVHCAELGRVGGGQILIDDPDGTVGHTGDAILGLKQLYVDEDACPAGDQRICTGYIAEREYSRSTDQRPSFRTAAARLITTSINDENSILSFRVFQPESLDATSSFNRPAETDTARIAALLAVDFLSTTLYDEGFIVGAGVDMDANDYTGQRPVDVLNDCAQQTADTTHTFFVRYQEDTGHLVLHYHSIDADIDAAGASISNVLSDLSSVVFTANDDWKLTRSPSRLVAGALVGYRGGWQYESNLATSYIYGYRDMMAQASDVGSATQASARATRYLTANATEDDRLAGTCRVPAADVNLIKAGQYLPAKFSHLPGYGDWRDCRVLQREIAQVEKTDQFYTVRYELTPIVIQEAAPLFYAALNHGSGFYGPPTPLYFPDGSEVVVWLFNGDTPASGWTAEPSSGAAAGIDGSASGWPWRGIRVTAYSIVRIDLQGGFGGVANPGATVTVAIRQNGTVISTQTQTYTGGGGTWQGTFTFALTGITAQAGDEFEVSYANTGWAGFQYFARTGAELNPLSHFRVEAP